MLRKEDFISMRANLANIGKKWTYCNDQIKETWWSDLFLLLDSGYKFKIQRSLRLPEKSFHVSLVRFGQVSLINAGLDNFAPVSYKNLGLAGSFADAEVKVQRFCCAQFDLLRGICGISVANTLNDLLVEMERLAAEAAKYPLDTEQTREDYAASDRSKSYSEFLREISPEEYDTYQDIMAQMYNILCSIERQTHIAGEALAKAEEIRYRVYNKEWYTGAGV